MAGTAAKKPHASTRTRTRKQPEHPRKSAITDIRGFERFAAVISRQAGRPVAFSAAVVLIVLWAVCGPLFHFSDTWQLVVNTSTTIITFLMVFLIQHTQNRDSLAIQIKLAELILVAKGAENEIATAEEHSEEYLENLRDAYHKRRGKQA